VIKQQYKFSDRTSRIIGCAMKVHSVLGNGFQELIYHRALQIELVDEKIEFDSEFVMPIYYKNQHIGTR
jgi:GxxExxY protein